MVLKIETILQKNNIKLSILLFFITGYVFLFNSCKEIQSKAYGGFTAYYKNEKKANKVNLDKTIIVKHGSVEFKLKPRKSTNTFRNKKNIIFDIEIIEYRSMPFKDEKEFVEQVIKKIIPTPDEIYAITIPGLTHSDFTHERTSNIEDFWEYVFEERGHTGYSLSEVRDILPERYLEDFDKQVKASEFNIILEWTKDGRTLQLNFYEDPDQEEILLRGTSLDYYPVNKK